MVIFVLVLLFFFTTDASKYSNSTEFIVIGDWGGVPYPPFSTDIEKSISRKLMNMANNVKIDFLLALGDNFYYQGVENEFDSRFENSFENVFRASDLFFPWYFIAGNHDWHGNVSAQIAYSNHSTRWNFPNYFYTIEKPLFDSPNQKIAIIMIDTILLCGGIASDFLKEDSYHYLINSSQRDAYWKFVKDELIRVQKYPYVFVAGHYPVWSVSHHGPTQCLVNKLDPLLKQYNVTAYINGHDHTLEHIQVPYSQESKMNYFTLGAANFFCNSEKNINNVPKGSLKFHWKNYKAIGGFALMSVTKYKLLVELISTDGDSLYVTSIPSRNGL